MLATLVRERTGPAASDLTHAGALLGDCVRDDAGQTLFHSTMHTRTHWLLGEHVVRGGQAVIPGTGFLEIARAALAHRPRKPANRNSRPRIPATLRCRARRDAGDEYQIELRGRS